MNLTNYTSVLNLVFPETRNDSADIKLKSFWYEQKTLSEDDGSLLSLKCRQLLTDFLPPLVECENDSSSKQSCENEVLNHP